MICKFTLCYLFLSSWIFAGPHPHPPKTKCVEYLKNAVAQNFKDAGGRALNFKEINEGAIIVDTNYLVALREIRSGTAGTAYLKSKENLDLLIKKMKEQGQEVTLYTTKTTAKEAAYQEAAIPKGTSLVKVQTGISNNNYNSILNELKKVKVGGNNPNSINSINDREIVADVLFSQRSPSNAVPKFATRDSGIVVPLCQLNPRCLPLLNNNLNDPEKYYQIRREFPDGFIIELIDERKRRLTMTVLPL